MRVLHIDTEMTWRGGENQLRLLLDGLQNTEVESHVALRPGSAAEERLSRHARIVPTPMRGSFDPIAAWRLAQHCRRERIDLIDAHTSNAHALGLAIRTFAPEVRLVVHRRVDYLPNPGLLSRVKYLTRRVDLYIAISDAIRRILATFGIPESRIRVARSAVSDAPYRAIDRVDAKRDLAKAYGIDERLPFVGNASALTDQKGHDVLLKALRILKDRGLPFHAFIAGTGELRDSLERLRTQLALEHDVTFIGFVDDVPRFLSGLDVFGMPSNFEGLGTIVLEATYAGLAVVASNVGGIPEMILDGKTGLLSPVGDAEAHARNLERALGDIDLRVALNAAAKERARREFSLGAMVGGNLDAYREVLRS